MCGVHLADDQHEIGIDGAFIPWKTECWKKIKEIAENLSIYREMTAEIDTSVQITTKYRFLELGGESGNDDDDSDEDLGIH